MTPERLGVHRSTVQLREHTSPCRRGMYPYRYRRPWISISAKWLANAGFKEGDRVTIHSYPGALVVFKSPDVEAE